MHNPEFTIGRIELENLSFRYSEHHPWLYRNLSLTLKPHKCTVIMGPSGCGKSTLDKPYASFEQIIQACQLAGIHETIEKLPEGYQTEIGEHGAFAR